MRDENKLKKLPRDLHQECHLLSIWKEMKKKGKIEKKFAMQKKEEKMIKIHKLILRSAASV